MYKRTIHWTHERDNGQTRLFFVVFKWYSQGLSPKKIKHKLDGNVMTNRGKPIWSYGSVEAILKNSHPNGSYVYYEKEIPCPRIVDNEVWEKVQKRLEQKKRISRGRVGQNYSYPLRQIMSCGHCGTQMGGRSQRYSENNTLISYCCLSHNKKWKESSTNGDWQRGKYCSNNVSMDCHKTEDGVWESLINILELSHQEREIFKQSLFDKKNKSQKTKDREIDRLKTRIEKTKESIGRLEESIVEKQIEKISSRDKAKSIQTFIDGLQGEFDRLSMVLIKDENDLVVLENDNLWIDWINDYQNNMDKLKNLSREERVVQIMRYVKKIEVFFNPETRKHKLNLGLKLPLIGDKIKWNDQSKKKKGYSIERGSNETVVELQDKVRHIRRMG